jgi:CubicO group peptidase (beta-lactamase class C family)
MLKEYLVPMKHALLLLYLFPGVFAATAAAAAAAAAQQTQIGRPDGQVLTTFSIDSMVRRLMDTAGVTGLGLGIINDNKVAYVQSYGYKNRPAGQRNDTATCFYAASLAKPLFASIVMQLVDSGIIDLDKPLYTYLPKPLPEYPDYADLASDERWKLITARECLDHSTGFPNWRFLNPHDNKKLEIFFTPGSRFAYSGEGLVLLQMVVEALTHRSLESLAQSKVFIPLGMTRTSYVWQPAFETDYAVGHDTNEDTLPKHRRKTPNAAGSMETTIADYTRFMAAMVRGKRDMFQPQIAIYEKHEFPSLDTSTTEEYQPIHLSYGLGWGVFASPFGNAFFKEGHDDGWEHYCIGFPDSKSGIVIMTNSSNGESIFKELVENLTGVTIPWGWEGYTPYRATVRLSDQTMQGLTGEYDGKLKVIISIVDGRLKVASPTADLPPTNLYAENDHHFFLKVMATDIEFVKDASGKVVKAVLDDEGDHYTLTKK